MDITPEMSQAIGASLLELQKLITCPLCSQLMDDPATLTCGHLFCYKCINSGIEYGVMVAKKGHPEDHIIDNSNNGRNKKKKVNKPKKKYNLLVQSVKQLHLSGLYFGYHS
eukprot:Tbor_TRINITY_DN5649_c0_g3::TRINITY_DN5649_c0_g3_i1::g.8364::m.8364